MRKKALNNLHSELIAMKQKQICSQNITCRLHTPTIEPIEPKEPMNFLPNVNLDNRPTFVYSRQKDRCIQLKSFTDPKCKQTTLSTVTTCII